MFNVGTVAGLTSVQILVQDTQKDVNKEGKSNDTKVEQYSTISTKPQRSSPRKGGTSRNQKF